MEKEWREKRNHLTPILPHNIVLGRYCFSWMYSFYNPIYERGILISKTASNLVESRNVIYHSIKTKLFVWAAPGIEPLTLRVQVK